MEAKEKMRREMLKNLTGIIADYEVFYLEAEEAEALKDSPLTKARYAKFEKWIKNVYEKGVLPDPAMDETQLMNEIDFAVRLYEALHHLALGQSLSSDIQRSYEERLLSPEEFLLDEADLPTWNELPSVDELSDSFNLDSIRREDYYEGRKLKDPDDASFITNERLQDRNGFEPTDQDLLNVHYAENEPAKRAAFLKSVDVEYTVEALSPARIFDISDILMRKNKGAEAQGMAHPDYLTTQELFDAFDEAGVRPATLRELLAYAKKYRKPEDEWWNASFTEEEKIQRADASSIYAVGSVFSHSVLRQVPCLAREEGKQELLTRDLDTQWGWGNYFLVFRKEIS